MLYEDSLGMWWKMRKDWYSNYFMSVDIERWSWERSYGIGCFFGFILNFIRILGYKGKYVIVLENMEIK